MQQKIIIDGIPMKLRPPDIDGNGIIGGMEEIQQKLPSDLISLKESSELGDSLKELNKDELENNSNMSGIDMRARLHEIEISAILALDSLVALSFLPNKCLYFTRQKKRLSASLEGLGRREIVQIVGGKRQHDKDKLSFADRLKNFVGKKEKKEDEH